MKARRMPSFAALAVIFAIALASPAEADKSAASEVTLKVAGVPSCHGRVISKNPSCVANRKVKLLEVAPEPAQIDFADNRTNGKGK